VAEERRAWHAGAAFWKGVKDINSASIGIEIVNPGHEFGYRAVPDAQVASVINLLADVRSRWMISDSRILGHSDIAPARKVDPGELFPWKRLAESGHGLWIEPPPSPGAPLGEGEEGTGVFALQAGLTRLGLTAPRPASTTSGPRPWSRPSSAIGCRAASTASPTARPGRGWSACCGRRRLMHPDKPFLVEDREVVLGFLRAHPFVTLAASVGGRPMVAQAPVVIRELDGETRARLPPVARQRADAASDVQGFRAVMLATGWTPMSAPTGTRAPTRCRPGTTSLVEAEGSVAPLNDAELIALLDEPVGAGRGPSAAEEASGPAPR
jgi:hypothetical protein